MIYDEPIVRTLGDTALNVEFGDESSIVLNFRILALDQAVRAEPPRGLIDRHIQSLTKGPLHRAGLFRCARSCDTWGVCDTLRACGTGKRSPRSLPVPGYK